MVGWAELLWKELCTWFTVLNAGILLTVMSHEGFHELFLCFRLALCVGKML